MTNRPTIELKAVESSAIRDHIDRAKQAERDGRWADACEVYENLVRDPEANVSTRLAALRWLGRAYLEQGNRAAALDVLEAAVASADIIGSPAAVAQALIVVGIAYQVSGDLDQAAAIYEAARAKAELAGDGARIAMIDQNLGTVAMIRGDLRGALEAFRLSHLGYQTLGMRNHEAQILNNIALAYMELGELADAEAAYNLAAEAFEEEGDHARQLDLAVNKVQLYIAGRRFDEALAQWRRASSRWQSTGATRSKARTDTPGATASASPSSRAFWPTAPDSTVAHSFGSASVRCSTTLARSSCQLKCSTNRGS